MIQIGWIDFSNDDRTKVKQLLSLIKPEGQLDELGIGYIRDAISNKLFPGISTIQTRAKYFFIVSYILRDYMRLSAKEKKKASPQNYLHKEQDRVQDLLKEKYKGSSEKGIIGFTMGYKKYVKRKPSEIYANGLVVFKCIESNGLPLNMLLINAQRQNKYLVEAAINNEEGDDFDIIREETFRIMVPYQPNWSDNLRIQLTNEESDFFKHRLKDKSNFKLHNSLLFELFENEELLLLFQENNFFEFVHQVQRININPTLKNNLTLGFNFNRLAEGAHLLYNHLLQQHFFYDEYQNQFLDQFMDWIEALENSMIDYVNFGVRSLLEMSGNRNYRQTDWFLSQWWQLVKDYQLNQNKITLDKMCDLIRKREYQVKKVKARLQKSIQNNPDVQREKRIGIQAMNFRYENAKVIVNDILNPYMEA